MPGQFVVYLWFRQTSAGCALAFPQGCAIVGCGIITCSGKTSFGNGMKVPLGLDGDGRLTPVYASISVRAVGANSAEHTPACTNACVHAHVLVGITADPAAGRTTTRPPVHHDLGLVHTHTKMHLCPSRAPQASPTAVSCPRSRHPDSTAAAVAAGAAAITIITATKTTSPMNQ